MESVDEIYRRYANYVHQYLLSQTHDPDLAEELTQETFYQAVRSIKRFDGSCKMTTWLCAIAKNQLITYRRKHPTMQPLDMHSDDGEIRSVIDQVSSARSAENEALESMGRVRILQMLHRLKEPYREVLHLRIFGDLSFREIGEVFGKSENWARVTFYRGKEHFRKEMEEYES